MLAQDNDIKNKVRRFVRKYHIKQTLQKRIFDKHKFEQLSNTQTESPLIASEENTEFLSHRNSAYSGLSQYQIHKTAELKKGPCGVGLGRLSILVEMESLGDDAYFTFDSTTHSMIGIADGVGGWNRNGSTGLQH